MPQQKVLNQFYSQNQNFCVFVLTPIKRLMESIDGDRGLWISFPLVYFPKQFFEHLRVIA